jgi:hypothetical protein
MKVIREVAATGVKGREYCKALAARRLDTSIDWQRNQNCPKSYVEAWDDKSRKWRNPISTERRNAIRQGKKSTC